MLKKYNETLNLPKTDFPMRANLPINEPNILEFWGRSDVYSKILDKNINGKKFVLHDGPPYANGKIHLGHALNKILKDFIIKFKMMTGYYTSFVPGWDVHGLPTEIKAKKSVDNYESLTATELREICFETAMRYLDIQRNSFKRLGVFADWNNPYVTSNYEFESKEVRIFAELVKKGTIYRGLKPVYWCSCCGTALAEAEIEYKEDHCDSIFIKFKLKDDTEGILSDIPIDLNNTYFLVWTTTAWTLPGNVAVSLNPQFEYSVVKLNNEYLILASERVQSCFCEFGIAGYKVIKNIKGKDLEGIVLYNPVLNRESVVITGDHINLESGTGCVHTAPGHGIEDFECCRKYNFEVVVPVDSTGHLNCQAGEFEGLSIDEASSVITDKLRSLGLLFHVKEIVHKYPHCWRCKEPVIFRATNQWFCSVSKLKDEACSFSSKVKWIPSWGKNRMDSMISERDDWCISRQRKWGVPIPVFFCENCGRPFVDYDTIIYISEIFKKYGSGVWFEKSVDFFMNENKNCVCGSRKFIKEKDIMDVWFDSGSSFYAVLPQNNRPADLYLEGSDQFRGWFQSSLLTSVALGEGAPYKSILTHGWVVDDELRKQSKSLGNVVNPDDIINHYGADILRLWISSADYTDNVKISNEILGQISESYRKIRNTLRFMLGNLYDFNPKAEFVQFDLLESVDKFMMMKIKKLTELCNKFYEKYEFYSVFHEIQNFCISDLSNFYLDIIKDRLYVSKNSSLTRKSAQTTIWTILLQITKILAPILSFTCEEVWKYILKTKETESVFMSDFRMPVSLKVDEKLIDYWNEIISLSDIIKKELEVARQNRVIGSSLEAEVVLTLSKNKFKNSGINLLNDLKLACVVSGVTVSFGTSIKVEVKKSINSKCQRCWMYDSSVGKILEYPDLCSRCIKVLYN